MYNTYIYTYVRSMFVASDTRLLKALLEQVQALAHELAPGHVTSVLWALAKLRQKPTNSLFAALSQRVSTMSLCLVPGDISTIMWSLTMLGMEADAVTILKSPLFDISTNMWSFTMLGIEAEFFNDL